jgi:hypothetical protein
MPYYINPINSGIVSANSLGDGIGINIKFNRAYPNNNNNSIGYAIYYDTSEPSIDYENFFNKNTNFLSFDNKISVDVYDFTPGQLYFFAVRSFEYNSQIIDPSQLPIVQTPYNTLRSLPESLLRSNISDTSLTIPLVDSETFPTAGIVKLGVELIKYLSIDASNNLIVGNLSNRGYLNTIPRIHNTDGYDGYNTYDPNAKLFYGFEDHNTRIFQVQNRFDINQNAYTIADGYKQDIKDILTTDLSVSDAENVTFPMYDYAGWHRTDPVQLLNGECVGSYIGGEQYCADSSTGVGRVVRGMSVQNQHNSRLEVLLSVTGEPVTLFSRNHTGIICDCVLPTSEYPDDRCPRCYGTRYVVGFEQYYNPRRSDGRILIRMTPYTDDLKMQEAGLESDSGNIECWTLTVPTIKDRDFFVRYNLDGSEEFRYEVIDSSRNRTINNGTFSMQGSQKFKAQRIRKTDTLYKVTAFGDTSKFPSKLQTSITNTVGIGAHSHTIVVNENVNNINKINQLTSVEGGHNHIIKNGIVQIALGHTHNIILI